MARRIGAGTGGAAQRLIDTLFDRDSEEPKINEVSEGVPDEAPDEAADEAADELADGLAGWLVGSARFRVFVHAYRDKIRKKLRGAADPEARRDVRAELRVAHLLLADRRIELAFEAYGSRRAGPDFTITFREKRSFNLEVTRLRGAPSAAAVGGHVLSKLRQLPPSLPNALLVAIEADSAQTVDVAATIRTLRARADRKDEAFFATRGFDGTRVFYEHFLRLGGVFVWCEDAAGDGRAALWTNRSARVPLPQPAARACLACLRTG
jgi:hypothetical protein